MSEGQQRKLTMDTPAGARVRTEYGEATYTGRHEWQTRPNGKRRVRYLVRMDDPTSPRAWVSHATVLEGQSRDLADRDRGGLAVAPALQPILDALPLATTPVPVEPEDLALDPMEVELAGRLQRATSRRRARHLTAAEQYTLADARAKLRDAMVAVEAADEVLEAGGYPTMPVAALRRLVRNTTRPLDGALDVQTEGGA